MHRVLLIDDDAELTGMLSQYLTSEGFECHVALSGKDGIQAAAQADFDTIILDIMLPDTDGIELLRSMRKTDRVAMWTESWDWNPARTTIWQNRSIRRNW